MSEENSKLTDEELEALKGTRTGEHLTPVLNGEATNVVKHDLVSKASYSDFDTRVLQSINRKLGDTLSTSFSDVLSSPSEIVSKDTRVLEYADYLQGIDAPCSLSTLSMKPMEGQALVQISHPIVFNSVDRFFGGAGISTIGFSPNRSFASSESAIVEIIIKLVAGALSSAWSSLLDVDFEKRDSENDPSKIQCFKDNESVVITEFEVKIGEDIEGEISILYPHSPIRMQTQKHAKYLEENALSNSEDLIWERKLVDACRDIEVELTAELCRISSTISEVSNLQVGDHLKFSRSKSVDIVIDESKVFKAILGKAGDRIAVKIV